MGSKKYNYEMIIGNDIGNGCVKCAVKTNDGDVKRVDFQSVAALDRKPKKPAISNEEIKQIINNIYNEMEISISSPSLATYNEHYLIGEAALSKGFIREFDVYSKKSKAEDELSLILTLATAAGRTLQTYYEENQSLPEELLTVDAILAMALPIEEYVKGFDDVYKNKLLNAEHIVTFHNFQLPVSVKILFSNVGVLAEGAAAQFAINKLTPEILKALIEQAKNDGMNLEGIEPQHIAGAEYIVGVDIGDGTTNFPVFTNGNFDKNFSDSINTGHGKILSESVEDLRNNFKLAGIDDRKGLSTFLNNKPGENTAPYKKKRYNSIADVVHNPEQQLANTITKKLNTLQERMPQQVDVVFVYGGGATPVKEYLYPQLMDIFADIPVIYLDSNFSRFLNREGLYAVAEMVANTSKK